MSARDILGGIFLAFILMSLVAAAMLCAYLLDRPRFVAIRETLAQSKYRWLACVIPFNPVITDALLFARGRSYNGIPAGLTLLAVVLSSIGSAAFSACRLCLP